MNKHAKFIKKHQQLYNEMIQQSASSRKKSKDLFYKEVKLIQALNEKIDFQN